MRILTGALALSLFVIGSAGTAAAQTDTRWCEPSCRLVARTLLERAADGMRGADQMALTLLQRTGSAGTTVAQVRTAALALTDAAVRRAVPKILRAAGRRDDARRLHQLAQITNEHTIEDARRNLVAVQESRRHPVLAALIPIVTALAAGPPRDDSADDPARAGWLAHAVSVWNAIAANIVDQPAGTGAADTVTEALGNAAGAD